MKGLLLKDWYMMKQYCRFHFLIAVLFMAISLLSNDNLFFVFYPCLLCGMIPVNLLGYDERSRWMQYSGALPYTKAQIVSGKYIIGLLTQLAILTVTAVIQLAKMMITHTFTIGNYTVLILLLLIISTFTSSITLPFIFKLGAEKGRTAYYVMIGFVCGASVLASTVFSKQLSAEIHPNLLLALLTAVSIGIYIVSWYLSVVFFKKREIH